MIMKLKSSLCVALIAMTALNSCEKDNKFNKDISQEKMDIEKSIILPDSIQVNVDNGILSFENEKSLQKCIDYLNVIGDEKFNQFETNLGYTSYRTSCAAKSETYLVDDDLLGTLMNKDKQVIVAGYLLTTNILEKTTTITPTHTRLKSTSGLLGKEMTVNWAQDVLEVIKTGERQALLKGYCNNTDKKKEWAFWPQPNMWGGSNDMSRIQAKVCFQRAGWYNSIIIKFKLEKRDSGGLHYKLHYKTENAKYKRRRRNTSKFDRENFINASKQGDEISHRPYSGTRRVDWASVPVWFDYEGRINLEDTEPIESDKVLLILSCT